VAKGGSKWLSSNVKNVEKNIIQAA
jgi:hypothetical protein